MLVLREIKSDGMEYNRVIGGDYYPCLADQQPDTFKRLIEQSKEFGIESEFYIERSFGIIIYNHGASAMLLTKGRIYYMMASDGGTFATYKERV
jgi:hypothetical protein